MSFKWSARENFCGRIAGWLVLGGLVSGVAVPGVAADWKYVVPAAKSEQFPPIFRAVFLSDERPENLTEHLEYRGTRRRYAQLRYGSPHSVRVTIVLDQRGSDQVDLYVDANRNRIIETQDRLQGNGPRWQFPLEVAIVGEDTFVETFPRQVVLKRGVTGRTILFATLGHMAGTVEFDNHKYAARRVDGNGNGSFADLQDRFWIDRNGDRQWNAFTEQMQFAPVLRIDGDRYAARTDPLGHRLTLAKLEDFGTVRLTISNKETAAATRQIAVTLVGRDGTTVPVSGLNQPVEVPAGEYRLNTLFISLADANGGQTCHFLFSVDSRRGHDRPWHTVNKDQTLSLNPIGTLELTCEIEGNKTTCQPGEELTVLTRLYTGDGLLINTCYHGTTNTQAHQSQATVALKSAKGKLLDEDKCGFF